MTSRARGFKAFGYSFAAASAMLKDELRLMERGKPLPAPSGDVTLTPAQLVRLVGGYVAWDEYERAGINAVHDPAIREGAVTTAAWRASIGEVDSGPFCPADFIGEELEGLLCS